MTTSAFEVSRDVERIRVPELTELFASAWWATGRTETETRGILAGSDVVVRLTDRSSGRLVGFARVPTDRTYLALILDVITAPDLRGSGIGTMIMDALLEHPWTARVRSVELVCQPDLIAFYRRWGFTDEVGQSRLMRRTPTHTDAGIRLYRVSVCECPRASPIAVAEYRSAGAASRHPPSGDLHTGLCSQQPGALGAGLPSSADTFVAAQQKRRDPGTV